MPGMGIMGGQLQVIGVIGATNAVIRYASIHTADPGLDGANEITYISQGGVAYARPMILGGYQSDADGWTQPTATNPVITRNRSSIGFPDPDDNQNPPLPEFWGLWTEAIGGNFIGGAEIIPQAEDPDHDSVIIVPIGGIVISQPVGAI